ncbi:glutathione S-transferase C-terminal domain-containing protein [Mameliella alba]|nr:glutathione S-transferase C-terminal domain-containing protein [Antarctobacter heliothermus]MBY6143824.1 glutathione S-transferase C-terminal domain-containing protein [Mameliella alba]MBY6162478.1 glutathione S-transferase C-terminal domain-containing protein [Mameliella alba]MBY6170952.1 glutathione S-transferase C-terminal domain-containing protein [Mameliella alba]MBY6175965.1 glutathione S-transferase C-terminal domain-containing protein [Mameliella alba]
MGQLVNGKWVGGSDRQIGASGWEPRKEGFRDRVSSDGSTPYPAVAGRYLLVECPGCPLAQRVSMLHRMKRLEKVVPTVAVLPVMGEHGREFFREAPGQPEPLTGFRYLYEAYLASDPAYTGRASTPVLFDLDQGRILSNNTRDIFAMFDSAFDALTEVHNSLLPPALTGQITAVMDEIYSGVTSAVYKCGFAREQSVYDTALRQLENALDRWEAHLAQNRWLLGNNMTEADFMLYTSLARYDAIYIPLFRTTTRRIADMPALSGFLARVHQLPGVAGTFDLHACMTHYFRSHLHINPTGLIPAPPALDWLSAPDKESRHA